MKKHPSPFTYQKKDDVPDNIVGWFAVSFKEDINHEYFFTVYADGRISPDIEPSNLSRFYEYLADPEVAHVQFVQSSTGRKIKYKW